MSLFTEKFLISPLSVPGCQLWLDAADSSTITLSGINVTQWRDKSGNARNTTSTIGNSTYNSNGINLRPSISFNDTGFRGPLSYTGTQLHAFMVGTIGNLGSFSRLVSVGNVNQADFDNPQSSILFCRGGAGTTDVRIVRNNTGVSASFGSYNTPFLATSAQYANTQEISVNGALVSQSTSTGTSASFNTTTYGIGVRPDPFVDPYLGLLGEIIIYNTYLSTSERQKIEGYLAWKWGLTGSLPSNHPFKNFRPLDGISIPTSLQTAKRVVTNRSVFLPTQMSACRLWLDATDASTFTFAGANITQWRDKSGNGFHFTNNGTLTPWGSQTSNCPTRSITAINGTPGVVFDSASKQSLAANDIFSGNQSTSYTMFTVGTAFIGRGLDGGFGNGWSIQSASTTCAIVFVSTGPASYNFGGGTTILREEIVSQTASNAQLLYYSAGTLTGSNTVANYTLRSSTVGFTMGITGVNTNFVSGNVGEVIIYTRVLSQSEREMVEGYLAWKWGLLTSLPNTHPLKFQAISPFSFPTVPRVLTQKFFSPRNIAGCQLWLDAADRSSIVLSGLNVTQWNDKSGAANHATGTVAPTYDAATRNILFNGSSQYFTLPNGAYPFGNTAYSIFIVAYTRNAANPQWVLAGGTSQSNQAIGLLFYTTNAVWHSWWINEYRVDNSIVNNTPAVINISYSTTRSIIVNGGLASVNSPGAIRANANTPNYIGRRPDSAVEFFNGGMGECIVFSSELPTPQRQYIEGYLAWKWGLQGNLPASHPFAKFPPSP